ncbi:MAG: PPIC-type domain [Actinomycetota bacterium]|nr:PPIC-type domain [Actinomycetota bacterium]
MRSRSALRTSGASLLLAGAILTGCSGHGDTPAARVGTEAISDKEVRSLTDQWRATEKQQATEGSRQPLPDKRLGQLALVQMIKTKLVAQLATGERVGLKADEVARALAAETSTADLDSTGWGKASFESALRSALLSKALAAKLFPVISIPENRLRAYFETHPDQFQSQWRATVDLAFFEEEKLARGFSTSTGAPGRFSETARASGAGDVLTSQLVNGNSSLPGEILTAISTMHSETMSTPVRAGRGYWIIHTTEVHREGPQTFETARPSIEQHLADQQRQEKFSDWLAARLHDAKIEVKSTYGKWPRDFL